MRQDTSHDSIFSADTTNINNTCTTLMIDERYYTNTSFNIITTSAITKESLSDTCYVIELTPHSPIIRTCQNPPPPPNATLNLSDCPDNRATICRPLPVPISVSRPHYTTNGHFLTVICVKWFLQI